MWDVKFSLKLKHYHFLFVLNINNNVVYSDCFLQQVAFATIPDVKNYWLLMARIPENNILMAVYVLINMLLKDKLEWAQMFNDRSMFLQKLGMGHQRSDWCIKIRTYIWTIFDPFEGD